MTTTNIMSDGATGIREYPQMTSGNRFAKARFIRKVQQQYPRVYGRQDLGFFICISHVYH